MLAADGQPLDRRDGRVRAAFATWQAVRAAQEVGLQRQPSQLAEVGSAAGGCTNPCANVIVRRTVGFLQRFRQQPRSYLLRCTQLELSDRSPALLARGGGIRLLVKK